MLTQEEEAKEAYDYRFHALLRKFRINLAELC